MDEPENASNESLEGSSIEVESATLGETNSSSTPAEDQVNG